jgi:hypothetical protein
MVSTATTRNRLEKQGTGENTGTWGSKLNTATIDLIDAALDGRTAFSLSGSKTLTSTNYAADESRMRFLDVTGGTGGTVTIPSLEKWYLVRNAASGGVTFTTGSGDTVEIAAGDTGLIACDATNVRSIGVTQEYVTQAIIDAGLSSIPGLPTAMATFLTNPTSANLIAAISDETGSGSLVFSTSPTLVTPNLGTPASGSLVNCSGFPASGLTGLGSGVGTFLATPTSANLASAITGETGSGALVFGTAPTLSGVTLSGATDLQGPAQQTVVEVSASAIDCSLGNYFTKTASGALTWTFTNVPASRAFSAVLELTNGGTGTQTWPASVKWPNGTAPTLTTSGVDVLGFITDDGGTTWRGVALMTDSK